MESLIPTKKGFVKLYCTDEELMISACQAEWRRIAEEKAEERMEIARERQAFLNRIEELEKTIQRKDRLAGERHAKQLENMKKRSKRLTPWRRFTDAVQTVWGLCYGFVWGVFHLILRGDYL